jgi:hypothetical protein
MSDVLATSEVTLLETTGADVHLLLFSIHHDGDALDVRLELAVNRTERVGNGTASDRVLTADLTNFGHDKTSIGIETLAL